MLDKDNRQISFRRQCAILGINRSSLYYTAHTSRKAQEQKIKALMDEIFSEAPSTGVDQMRRSLKRFGLRVGDRRIRRYMDEMGLHAVYPKPKTSLPHPEHKIYPYLLKGLKIARPNQVWCADITWIRLVSGFTYLVAIMDWYSRYVVAFKLSNSLDRQFCLDCLDEALDIEKPTIFNTDQGCQFTSYDFTNRLKDKKIQISMDGRGRVFDNIFIERLWRTVKYEDVYLREYRSLAEVRSGLTRYFHRYNLKRPHSSLNNLTPWEAYTGLESPWIAQKRASVLSP